MLADYLQDHSGITLNGVILISSVLNFQNLSPGQSNDLPYALYLPTYTATAFYHKKLSPELEADRGKTLEQAQAFALGPYLTALGKGDKLDAKERAEIVAEVRPYRPVGGLCRSLGFADRTQPL